MMQYIYLGDTPKGTDTDFVVLVGSGTYASSDCTTPGLATMEVVSNCVYTLADDAVLAADDEVKEDRRKDKLVEKKRFLKEAYTKPSNWKSGRK